MGTTNKLLQTASWTHLITHWINPTNITKSFKKCTINNDVDGTDDVLWAECLYVGLTPQGFIDTRNRSILYMCTTYTRIYTVLIYVSLYTGRYTTRSYVKNNFFIITYYISFFQGYLINILEIYHVEVHD